MIKIYKKLFILFFLFFTFFFILSKRILIYVRWDSSQNHQERYPKSRGGQKTYKYSILTKLLSVVLTEFSSSPTQIPNPGETSAAVPFSSTIVSKFIKV